jgi:hypothetical protein
MDEAFGIPYPCIFYRILVFSICCPYKVIIRDLGFPRKFLWSVSGLEWFEEGSLRMRTLKISAPLSQNSLGSTPAFAAAR